MSLLNQASLIVVPSGYKEGTLYSAKPINGDGDFTFSRGSNLAATRVNSEGLIEKGRENLLLQSNQFDTTWTTTRLSGLTSGQSGYDGSSDAWSVIPNTANDDHKIYQSISQTGVVTFSVYAKANGYNGLALVSSNTNNGKFFNLSNGTLGNDFNSSPIDSTITEVSNGWYRCEVVFNVSAGNFFTIYVSSDGISTHSFSGNGTNGIYIQDAQLEQGLVSTDVITTTTTTAQAGILEDMPRLDYSGGATCGSLILEPQRTNLVYQSEYLGAWSAANCTLTANSITSPEGVVNSFKITENSAASTQHRVSLGSIGGSSATYTMSAYVKNSSGTRMAYIDMGLVTAHFNFTTETIYSATGTADWEDVGNGWYRIWVTSNSAISVGTCYVGLSVNNNETYSGDGTSAIEFYGIQLEAGGYPTSYIPTYGSSVTRSADSCSKTGISSLIGQSEGVVYVEYDQKLINQGITRRIFALSDGTTSNRITAYINSANGIDFYVRNSGGDLFLDQASSPIGNTKGVHKIAAAYKNGDYAVYLDGVEIISGAGTAGTIPACSRFDLGSQIGSNDLYEPMMQSLLFPTRLTNAELASLTTI
jgi:hypothetical protein